MRLFELVPIRDLVADGEFTIDRTREPDNSPGVGHGAREAAAIPDTYCANVFAPQADAYLTMIAGLALLGAIECRRKTWPTPGRRTKAAWFDGSTVSGRSRRD